ncbi:glycine-rich domain-containing protein-like [Weizmannia sp. CD-2023]|uniref:glycine-rich domain-containing protein-like n=1 Tax=Weizmannia sp. CD-2023 TaxID=3037263 RepID=UPI002E1E4899|nr:glycine-rich domain-containing protein-like [Weizmannia sp. CD-2023]
MSKHFPNVSVDLIEAARRSDGVLSRLSEEELTCIKNRYLKFLYLVKKYPYTSICPTYDIDEMWHLHILHPQKYYNDCMDYFGCILDHNPGYGKEESELPHLLNIYRESLKKWSVEFKEDYNIPLSDKVKELAKNSTNAEVKTCYNEPLKAGTCYNEPLKAATCYNEPLKAGTCYNEPLKGEQEKKTCLNEPLKTEQAKVQI